MKDDRYFRTRLPGSDCVYCGELATSDDHWPPNVYSHEGYILPACHECNLVAGARCPTDFDARIGYVKGWIARRYRRLINSPAWKQEDIDELGDGLKRRILRWQRQKEKVVRRLAWDASAYLSFIALNTNFARTVVVNTNTTSTENAYSTPASQIDPSSRRKILAELAKNEPQFNRMFGYLSLAEQRRVENGAFTPKWLAEMLVIYNE